MSFTMSLFSLSKKCFVSPRSVKNSVWHRAFVRRTGMITDDALFFRLPSLMEETSMISYKRLNMSRSSKELLFEKPNQSLIPIFFFKRLIQAYFSTFFLKKTSRAKKLKAQGRNSKTQVVNSITQGKNPQGLDKIYKSLP